MRQPCAAFTPSEPANAKNASADRANSRRSVRILHADMIWECCAMRQFSSRSDHDPFTSRTGRRSAPEWARCIRSEVEVTLRRYLRGAEHDLAMGATRPLLLP